MCRIAIWLVVSSFYWSFYQSVNFQFEVWGQYLSATVRATVVNNTINSAASCDSFPFVTIKGK